MTRGGRYVKRRPQDFATTLNLVAPRESIPQIPATSRRGFLALPSTTAPVWVLSTKYRDATKGSMASTKCHRQQEFSQGKRERHACVGRHGAIEKREAVPHLPCARTATIMRSA